MPVAAIDQLLSATVRDGFPDLIWGVAGFHPWVDSIGSWLPGDGTIHCGAALIRMAKSLQLVSVQSEAIPGVVASAAYVGGRRVAEIPIAEAGEWSRKPGHVVWIGLHEPGLDLLRQVQKGVRPA